MRRLAGWKSLCLGGALKRKGLLEDAVVLLINKEQIFTCSMPRTGANRGRRMWRRPSDTLAWLDPKAEGRLASSSSAFHKTLEIQITISLVC